MLLLELSRSLATYGKPQRDIIFVALNAEEFGLLGSKAFAESNLFEIKNSQVINFDMIGSPNYPLTLVQGTKFKNTSSSLLSTLESICKKDKATYEVVYEDSSDHASFNNLNIDAVTLCHSDKTNIHTPNDKLEYIDTNSIDNVYKIVDEVIKNSCYSGLTRFAYSLQCLLWLFIVLVIIGIVIKAIIPNIVRIEINSTKVKPFFICPPRKSGYLREHNAPEDS